MIYSSSDYKHRISVIVPIYCVAPYLQKCIDSLLVQITNNDFALFIDDGSPDDSSLLAETYLLDSVDLILVHRCNAGLSTARNTGIKLSFCEYLMFMDSDDWWNEKISLSSLRKQIDKQPQIEMFLFYWLDYFHNKGYYIRKEHLLLNKLDTSNRVNFYRSLLEHGSLEVSACSKILSLNFIREFELFFKEGMKGEDNEWMIRVLRVLTYPTILDYPLYIYRQRNTGSITSSIKLENIKDILDMISDSISFNANYTSDVKEFELSFCAYMWFVALGLSGKFLKLSEYNMIKHYFENSRCVISHISSPKARIALMVYKWLGFSLTARLLSLYISLNNKYKPNRHFLYS